ncbi:hypothetical protein FA95DRAFT_1596767 [Auriscalpium vulgare]|uniref:Uncharacterized protein n=1 Tax=Auriscalpium vulgare TaxID=40419 RepID=A0ACB8RP40_9AGAM|nr:hypothetical protein FA95DRAFT_1596767 [Auriscalpium vulgare]
MIALPHDVHVEIINWVFRNSQHTEMDYPTLRACSTVCKSWIVPSQRLLFRRIQMFSSRHNRITKSNQLLIATLQEKAHLRTYMRRISFWYHPLLTGDDDFLALLALSPNVTDLFIILPNANPIATNLFVPGDMVERLRALDLRATSLTMCGMPSAISHFLSIWSDLQSLQLDLVGESFLRSSGPPVFPSTPRSIKIHCYGWESPLSMLEGSIDLSAVRELEAIGANWHDSTSRLTRTPVFGNLTALIMDGALPPKVVLDRCAQLKTLVFAICPTATVALPATLRHVGYHAVPARGSEMTARAPGVDVQHLLRALRPLPALYMVTTTRALYPPAVDQLMLGCKEMRVDFAVYGNANAFQVAPSMYSRTIVLTYLSVQGVMAMDWI